MVFRIIIAFVIYGILSFTYKGDILYIFTAYIITDIIMTILLRKNQTIKEEDDFRKYLNEDKFRIKYLSTTKIGKKIIHIGDKKIRIEGDKNGKFN